MMNKQVKTSLPHHVLFYLRLYLHILTWRPYSSCLVTATKPSRTLTAEQTFIRLKMSSTFFIPSLQQETTSQKRFVPAKCGSAAGGCRWMRRIWSWEMGRPGSAASGPPGSARLWTTSPSAPPPWHVPCHHRRFLETINKFPCSYFHWATSSFLS